MNRKVSWFSAKGTINSLSFSILEFTKSYKGFKINILSFIFINLEFLSMKSRVSNRKSSILLVLFISKPFYSLYRASLVDCSSFLLSSFSGVLSLYYLPRAQLNREQQSITMVHDFSSFFLVFSGFMIHFWRFFAIILLSFGQI